VVPERMVSSGLRDFARAVPMAVAKGVVLVAMMWFPW
jgi:hypothetical protein